MEPRRQLQKRESAKLHNSTIEIQDHLLFILQNSGVHLLPVMAKKGTSSIQNEKMLLMKQLLLHSKSYVEEPVLPSTSSSADPSQNRRQNVDEERSEEGLFGFDGSDEEFDYEDCDDEDLDDLDDQEDDDREERGDAQEFQLENDQDIRQDVQEVIEGRLLVPPENQESEFSAEGMAFIQEPVIENSQEETSARIVLISNSGISYREITEAEDRIECEENIEVNEEGDQELDPQP